MQLFDQPMLKNKARTAKSFGLMSSRPLGPVLSDKVSRPAQPCCSNNTIGKRLRAAEQTQEKSCDVDKGEGRVLQLLVTV